MKNLHCKRKGKDLRELGQVEIGMEHEWKLITDNRIIEELGKTSTKDHRFYHCNTCDVYRQNIGLPKRVPDHITQAGEAYHDIKYRE